MPSKFSNNNSMGIIQGIIGHLKQQLDQCYSKNDSNKEPMFIKLSVTTEMSKGSTIYFQLLCSVLHHITLYKPIVKLYNEQYNTVGVKVHARDGSSLSALYGACIFILRFWNKAVKETRGGSMNCRWCAIVDTCHQVINSKLPVLNTFLR